MLMAIELTEEIPFLAIILFASWGLTVRSIERLHNLRFISTHYLATSIILTCSPILAFFLFSIFSGFDAGTRYAGLLLFFLTFLIIKFPLDAWLSIVELREQKRRDSKLKNKIEYLTKQENVKGHHERLNLGWVRTYGKQNREEVEESLKLDAAKLGANALIKYYWQRDSESYTAGIGRRGNPYIKNRPVFSGEAVAVFLEKASTSKHPRETRGDSKSERSRNTMETL